MLWSHSTGQSNCSGRPEAGSKLSRALYHRAALLLGHENEFVRKAARADLVTARDAFVEMGAARDLALAERELAP